MPVLYRGSAVPKGYRKDVEKMSVQGFEGCLTLGSPNMLCAC